MSYFNEEQINKIVEIAFAAGEIAADAQKFGNFAAIKKSDNSSVTTADIAVSKFIDQKLSEFFPKIKIVCEEGILRKVDDIFWLIDPIDGTSSFIEGSSEFAINIALVKNKKVVFGLIYAPLFEGGKMIFSDAENKVVLQNKLSKKLLPKPEKYGDNKLKIITSVRSKNVDIENFVKQFYANYLQNYTTEKLSSAVKFFRIVEGDANLYLHFRPSMEWDIAAGQFLIELMGGKVKKLSFNETGFEIGEEMLYKKPNFANQPFVSFAKNF